MPTFEHLSRSVMTEFAKRQLCAPTCPRCGQRFQMSFRGGRLAELSCACGTARSIDATAVEPLTDGGEASFRTTRNMAELDS